MTINELHNAVKIELDKTSSLELPAFEQEEIDYWLDEAILRFVEEKINEFLKGSPNTKIQDELKYLVIHNADLTATPLANTETGKTKLYTLAVSSSTINSVYILDLFIKLTSKTLEDGTTATNLWQRCKRINPMEISNYLSTSFNTPYFEQPVFYSTYISPTSTEFVVITDYFTTGIDTNIEVSYIKKPAEVDTVTRTSEYTDLPSYVHHTIVKLAAFLMLENIESQRTQTNVSLINNSI